MYLNQSYCGFTPAFSIEKYASPKFMEQRKPSHVIVFECVESTDYSSEFTVELLELATEIIKQFNNVLEVDFDEEALIELIHTDDADIPLLRHRIIKGEFLWRISRN